MILHDSGLAGRQAMFGGQARSNEAVTINVGESLAAKQLSMLRPDPPSMLATGTV